MNQDKTIVARTSQSAPADPLERPVSAASPLLEQARGFAQVARDAVNECERGEDALKELHRRRNKSGQ